MILNVVFLLLSLEAAIAGDLKMAATRISLCGNSLKVEGSGVREFQSTPRETPTVKQGLESEKTSLDVDYLNIGNKIPKDYVPKHASEDEVSRRLFELGWGNPMFVNGRYDIASFIAENNIVAPTTEYAYHGTSTANYQSILANGLDNMRGSEVHSGGAMGRTSVTYSGDAQYAQEFAVSAASISSGKPMLLRFPLSRYFNRPIKKSETGSLTRQISSASLEYSLDGGATWQRYDSVVPR